MAKEIINKLKLEIPAGKATPAPPIGPILGQAGIPIGNFVQEFNAKTASMGDDIIPVNVTVFKDRSFKLEFKKPTVAGMLKRKARIQKGSGTPNKTKVGKVRRADIKEIAEIKMPDFNTKKLASAERTVEGVAKALGLEIAD